MSGPVAVAEGERVGADDCCPMCHGSGWVLDCDPRQTPVALEILPCLLPDCGRSGADVAVISVYDLRLSSVARHPATGQVMSLSR